MSIRNNPFMNNIKADPYESANKSVNRLVRKWEGSKLLNGLKNEQEKRSMAILLENQARQLILESSRVNGDGTEEWGGMALPIVRRSYAGQNLTDLVSLQPMVRPHGLVFFLDFQYGSGAQPGFTQDTSLFGGDKNYDGSTGLFGRTNSPTGGLYGMNYGYSINDFTSASLTATITSASFYEVNFMPELSGSIATGQVKKVTVTLGSDIDNHGASAFRISSGSVATELKNLTAFTSIVANSTNWDVTFFVTGSTAELATTTGWTVKYHKQPTSDSRGDFEDLSVSGSYQILDIPEVDIKIKQEQIVAKSRKLKSSYTQELVQDLKAYLTIDPEVELTQTLSDYIGIEIGIEILDMLVRAASYTEYWSAKIGYVHDATSRTFIDAATNGQAYTQQTWFATLGSKINKVSNEIHTKTFVGGANFLVMHPNVATVLESLNMIKTDTDGTKSEFALGVEKAGTFGGRYTVYKSPYMIKNVILAGYKSPGIFNAGATYNPYIPFTMSPTLMDYNNFTPRKMIATRYAKKLLRSEMYAKIVIGNVDQI